MYRLYKLADLVGGGMDLIEALLGRGRVSYHTIGYRYGERGDRVFGLSDRANSAWLPLITKPKVRY